MNRTARRYVRRGRRRRSVDFDGPSLLRVGRDAHGHRVVGQQRFDLLGPLHQTQVARIEVLFVSEVVGLFGSVDPVEVEMVDGPPVPAGVLVDDGERGTRNVSAEPSCAAISRISVVLPAPIAPRKATTVRVPSASITASAASGSSARESICRVFMAIVWG